MEKESVVLKIWRVIYPALLFMAVQIFTALAVQSICTGIAAGNPDSWVGRNVTSLSSAVSMAVTIAVCFVFFRRDNNAASPYIYRKPWFFALIIAAGAMAWHGLSILFSLIRMDSLFGDSYNTLSGQLFSAPFVLAFIQIVILAPLAEELVFRGLIYKRLEKYTGGFWIPAAVSSLIFAVCHMNPLQMINGFIAGFLFAAVYSCFRNLWTSVAMHAGLNLISVILAYTGFVYPSDTVMIITMVVFMAAAAVIMLAVFRPLRAAAEEQLRQKQ
ncbi:MAG: CPBP family intramembrane metalloprotease [Parasporobacterium sp.]|nr:CPBP family intramembrane metalloprotease [Parasporobacterium sp.]